jgi:hypothetical protein
MNKAFDVQMQKLGSGSDLSDVITSTCFFCDRIVDVSATNFEACKNLAHGRFHCPFCIRHNLHTKNNKNVLILTFKAVIGFYYHIFYKMYRTMWLGQIVEYIDRHRYAGLLNPLFVYDEDNFMWFVDFNRVGKTKHKMPLSEVKNTVKEIIESFNLKTHVQYFNTNNFYDKYEKAIDIYYQQRQRPTDKKILAPTLKDCGGNVAHNIDHESMKNVALHFFFNSSLTQSPSMIINKTCESQRTTQKEKEMKIVVNVRQSKTGWTGTVSLPNVAGARLSRKDGETTFPTKSALTTVARSLAKKLGAEVEYAEPAKKAAKKTPTAKKAPAKKATKSTPAAQAAQDGFNHSCTVTDGTCS